MATTSNFISKVTPKCSNQSKVLTTTNVIIFVITLIVLAMTITTLVYSYMIVKEEKKEEETTRADDDTSEDDKNKKATKVIKTVNYVNMALQILLLLVSGYAAFVTTKSLNDCINNRV